jgi:hypothetical protein
MNSKWLWLIGGILLGYFAAPMVLSHVMGLMGKS